MYWSKRFSLQLQRYQIFSAQIVPIGILNPTKLPMSVLWWILFLLGIGILAFCVQFIVVPKRRVAQLTTLFEARGWKVKVHKFAFLGFELGNEIERHNRNLKFLESEDYNKFDIVIGNLASNAYVIPISTELVKATYNQMSKLHKSEFYREVYSILGGGGLVFTEDKKWKKKRRIISSIFHYDFLKAIELFVTQETDKRFSEIDEKLQKGQKLIPIRDSLSNIFSAVVVKYFFGSEMSNFKHQGETFTEFLITFANELDSYLYSKEHMLWRGLDLKYKLTSKSKQLNQKLEVLLTECRVVIEEQIRAYHQKQERMGQKGEVLPKNIIHALLERKELEKHESETSFSVEQIIGDFAIFFVAGTDTTANTVNCSLYHLDQHPKCKQKLKQECLKIKAKGVTVESLKEMEYANAFMNETLRLSGPAPFLFGREVATDDFALGGVSLPKGSLLWSISYINHYNPSCFEDPQSFNPDRWLSKNGGSSIGSSYEYLPFGGGERSCIGQNLARLEYKLVMIKILTNYEFKAQGGIEMAMKLVYQNLNQEFSMERLQQSVEVA